MTTTGEQLVTMSTLTTGSAIDHFANILWGVVIADGFEVELQAIDASLAANFQVDIGDGLTATMAAGYEVDIDSGITAAVCGG